MIGVNDKIRMVLLQYYSHYLRKNHFCIDINIAQLKYTYEQVLSSLAEKVNGKAEEYEKRRTTGRNMLGDNIIDIIPANKEKFQVG